MDRAGIFEVLKAELSEKRYRHSLAVESLAVRLAMHYGEDGEKAFVAALLHDITKELPEERLLQILEKSDKIELNAMAEYKNIWHSFASEVVAKERFGIADEDILNAIAYHTTGRPGMTTLEKIVYLADTCGEDRDYEGCSQLRDLCFTDLDAGMVRALGDTLFRRRKQKRKVFGLTEEAYRFYNASAEDKHGIKSKKKEEK